MISAVLRTLCTFEWLCSLSPTRVITFSVVVIIPLSDDRRYFSTVPWA